MAVTASEPAWRVYNCRSSKETLAAVAEEGVLRLVLRPTADEVSRVGKLLRESLGNELGGAVDDFMHQLALDAMTVGIGLARELASSKDPGSYEAWLAQAIRSAGLADFEPGSLDMPAAG